VGWSAVTVPGDHSFALLLTHDVDRPDKTLPQALYHALRERRIGHLRSVLSDADPYWQFDEVMALERELGVRSAFYFLSEPHLLLDRGPTEWLRPNNWIQHLGRYDVHRPDLAAVIRQLDDGGWEVGLHGSYHSTTDRDRLAEEKRLLEDVLCHPVRGGRQHYLRAVIPDTWRLQSSLGLRYDASLGSAEEYGFHYGYDPLCPFDDEFVVFPLTVMDQALPDPDVSFADAWAALADLVETAAEHGAVMTALWHPRLFNEEEFPGYRRLYRRLVDRALDAGAWVGPPGDLYDHLQPNEEGRSFRDEPRLDV